MARERTPTISASVGYMSLDFRIHNVFVEQLEPARDLHTITINVPLLLYFLFCPVCEDKAGFSGSPPPPPPAQEEWHFTSQAERHLPQPLVLSSLSNLLRRGFFPLSRLDSVVAMVLLFPVPSSLSADALLCF